MRAPGAIPAPAAEDHAELEGALRIGRNVSLRLASQAIGALINVGAMVLLGRALSAEGYGEYAFYYALIPLIASVSDAGVGIIVTREIARDPRSGPRLLGDAILVKAAVSGSILLVVVTTARGVLDPARAALVSLVAATALIDIGQDVSVWVLRARERLDVEALLWVVSQVVWVGLLALGVLLKAGLFALLAAATVAFAVRLTIGAVIVARRLCRPEFRPDRARIRSLLARGVPFGAAMGVVVLYGRVGLLMLAAFATSRDVAYFNVGYLLSQPLGFVASAMSLAAFPMLARRADQDHEALSRALRRTSRYVLLLTLPMTVGLMSIADPLIAALFPGRGFERAAAALRVMSPGLLVIFLNLVSRYVLAALDRQRHYLHAVLVGLVVNAALGVALIPSFGFLGACVAYLGAELAIWAVCQRVLSRYIRPAELAADAAKPLLAAGLMGLLLIVLRGAPVALVVLAGCAAYVALLRLLGAFSDQELDLLRRIPGAVRVPGSIALRKIGGES